MGRAFGVWRLAFGVRRSAFGVWRLACGVWRLAFGVWRLAFGVWRLAFGVWRLAFGVWRLAFGVWRLAFGVWCSAFGVRRSCSKSGVGVAMCWSIAPCPNWTSRSRVQFREGASNRVDTPFLQATFEHEHEAPVEGGA